MFDPTDPEFVELMEMDPTDLRRASKEMIAAFEEERSRLELSSPDAANYFETLRSTLVDLNHAVGVIGQKFDIPFEDEDTMWLIASIATMNVLCGLPPVGIDI